MGELLVSLHDVSPATVHETRRWLSLVEDEGMSATLLVIAGLWRGRFLGDDDTFGEVLRSAARSGHEIALHGWTHRHLTEGGVHRSPLVRVAHHALSRGCGEFADLDEGQASSRIASGLAVLHREGLDVRGFTPPAWLSSAETRRAAAAHGLDYVTSQVAIHDLRNGIAHRIFAISQRPGCSLTRVAGIGNELLGEAAVRGGRSIRLALHPDDLRHEELFEATRRLLVSARRHGVAACTYADFVDQRIGRREFAA